MKHTHTLAGVAYSDTQRPATATAASHESVATVFSDALSKINCENTSTLRQGGKELDQLNVLSIAFAHPFNKPPDKKRLLLNAKTLLADACMFVSNNAPSEDSPADQELTWTGHGRAGPCKRWSTVGFGFGGLSRLCLVAELGHAGGQHVGRE